MISEVKENVKSVGKEKRKVEYGIHSLPLKDSFKWDRSPGSDGDNGCKTDAKTKSSFKICYKGGGGSNSGHQTRYYRHAECFNCNSIGHTAMDCTAIKFRRKVRLQSGSKANAGKVVFVGGQSKVSVSLLNL